MKRFIRPMLATLVSEPFHRPGWVYEEKYDGDRVIAYRHARRVRLMSRNFKDVTAEFKEIARALDRLPGVDLILDGEDVQEQRPRSAAAKIPAGGRQVDRGAGSLSPSVREEVALPPRTSATALSGRGRYPCSG